MKKNTIIILTLILITTLTGCFKDSKKTKSEDNTIQFISSTASYYKNGAAFSDYYNNQPTMFLDFDTMKTSPLCAKPNCNHITSECLSNTVGTTPVFYNDYIYYFTSNYGTKETPDGPEFYINSKLMKASLETSATEVVCEFHDCVPPEHELVNFVRYKNELYFVGDDYNPKKDESGLFFYTNVGGNHFLCSINLDTGEYTNFGSIYDGDKEYEAAAYSSNSFITGVYNNKMYLAYNFVKDNDKLQSGGDFETTHLNFEFDFETKTWKESELPYSRFMNNDSYIYYDFENKSINIIYKDKEMRFPLEFEIVVYSEFNGKLFMPTVGKWYDLSDCSEHSMGEYEGYNVIAYHDNSYILLYRGLTAKITEEELLALE